jgi:hypothetical protein
MAANMQHMMMPQAQHPQLRQRASPHGTALQQLVYTQLANCPVNQGTWQSNVPIQERLSKVLNLYVPEVHLISHFLPRHANPPTQNIKYGLVSAKSGDSQGC